MDRKHLILLALFIFSLFSILIAQFYRIQIVQGDKWALQAKRQHYFVVNDPFMRGTFFSNTSVKKGHPPTRVPFVIDIQKFHLYCDPESIPEARRDEIAAEIAALLAKAPYEEIRGQFDLKSRSRRLCMWLSREEMEQVQKWWHPYSHKLRIARNALFFVSDYQRSYPFGKLLGQVLHTVQHQKDEVTKQAIPTGGLELSMHHYLVGKPGQRLLMRSPRNSLETGEVISTPENGADIYLTINHVIQAIAEEEIEKGVKAWGAKGGWAVMMEPFTGEILALAQYPFFDPAEYQEYFNDPEKMEHTRVRGILDAHEPGSIMKPVTVAIGLRANELFAERGEKPLFNPLEKVATFNIPFKGRKPVKDTRRHDFLNMYMAVQKSSNVYMARLIDRVLDRLGAAWYREMLTETFGFGSKTNIELVAESPGMVPTPGKKHPNGRLEWSIPTPYSLAFGHNLQVNSIQVLRAYSIFANGGYLVKPTLIRKVVKGEEEVLIDNTQHMEEQKPVISRAIIDEVVKAMRFVTKPGGSSHRAELHGYTQVGKSGTANKVENGVYSETKYCSSFVGYTPLSKPAFVLIVTLDEPKYSFLAGVGKTHHGGISSSTIFREIAKRTLEYLGIAPDDPYGYHVNDPRYDAAKAEYRQEVAQLRELYEKWNVR